MEKKGNTKWKGKARQRKARKGKTIEESKETHSPTKALVCISPFGELTTSEREGCELIELQLIPSTLTAAMDSACTDIVGEPLDP